MPAILIALAVVDIVAYAATAWAGLHATGGIAEIRRHFVLGLFSAIATCFTHSVVFVYFIGTLKAIKEAVARIPPQEIDFVRQARRSLALVLPFPTFATILFIGATLTGGAADVGMIPAWVHLASIIGAVAFNLFSFWWELRYIRLNGALIDAVDGAMGRGKQ